MGKEKKIVLVGFQGIKELDPDMLRFQHQRLLEESAKSLRRRLRVNEFNGRMLRRSQVIKL